MNTQNENKLDELKEYREKLRKLSEEEKKQRDLYLKKLADGTIQGPPTGYPSIDKQWLKYYSDEAISDKVVQMSIYEAYFNSCKDHLDDISVEFEENQITNRKILENICIFEEFLKSKNINKGDTVSIAPVNTPESIYLIMAVNKIGAKISILDPRANEHMLTEDIKNSKECPKIFVGVELVKNTFENIYQNVSIDNRFYYSPMNSSKNKISNLIYNIIRKINKTGKYRKDKNLLKQIKQYEEKKYSIEDFSKFEKFEKMETAFILHTGGTTGVHKGVELSNEAINSTVHEHKFLMDGIVDRGATFINPLPQFITYGFTTLVLSLCRGFKMVMLAVPSSDAFSKAIIDKKANLAFGGPIHWEGFCNNKYIKNQDLSFLRVPVAGGEKIPLSIKENTNEILKSHNCSSNLFDGYGLSETCGVFSVAVDNNTVGSVGIPLVHNNVGIFDPETNQELQTGKVGEIRIYGDSMMNCYENNDSENERVTDINNGQKWFKTGDLGSISEKSELYVTGRIKRIFVCGVDKVYQESMEELICTLPYIQKCAVVAIPDKELRNVPKVHVVLKNEYQTEKYKKLAKYDIEKLVSEKISKNVVPHYYEFQNDLIYTPNGKVDFKKIQENDVKNMSISTEKIR